MSHASFPRPEHLTLLRQLISARIQSCRLPIVFTERRVDQYRCCYRFGFRQDPAQDWVEFPIHFQIAERIEATGSSAELDRLLDLFLERHFALGTTNQPPL